MIIRSIILLVSLLGTTCANSQDLNLRQADSLNLLLKGNMPDTVRVEILFRLAEFYINGSDEHQNYLDIADMLLKRVELINANLHSEDIKGFQILMASMIAKGRKQKKQGKEMAENAISILSKGNNTYYLGKAYFSLSDYYDYTDRRELPQKIRLVELAIQYFSQSKNIEAYANSLKYIADLYEINDQKSKVLENLDLSLKLYHSIHYPKLSGVYVLYNRYYYLRGNYKLALDYCLMALRDAERAKDSSLSYCQINNYMAITLCHLRERERAIGYYKVALQIAEKYNHNRDVLLVMNNMVRNYIELKKPQEALELMNSIPKELLIPTSDEDYILTSLSYASIYLELKKYRETGVYCNHILNLIKEHMPRAQVVNDFYNVIIRYFLESRQYASAGIYIKKIDSVSREMADPARISDNFYLAFRLDTATGASKSAIAKLLKYQNLHDSLFDERTNRQMQQMEVEYETEKNKKEIRIKDQDIALLNQKNQLQQSGLERAKLERNFIISGIVLLLTIVFLLYRRYRNKQQINKMIISKNELLQHLVTEKEWLLKELHHRVKNNLQIVMSLLNSQAAYLKDEASFTAIKESQHRVHAISLLHHKLYQSDNMTTVDMQVYIKEAAEYLSENLDPNHRIKFNLSVMVLHLDVAQALPLGLIINEAITNAVKYAFPGNAKGKVAINMIHKSSNSIVLTISDDGVGMAKEFDWQNTSSLGITLMNGLCKQIDGSFEIFTDSGFTVQVTFTPTKSISNHSFYS